ncbi:hypothetical protein chiPu_0011818 [Chiloscyllium punctatum]|uniref:Uncharacterized protein n=1 Tax=Chiloscyllium punctatum TaxID=137246 RepID=A0A401SSH6_CHIPU|nr:hypothetical protein [Chiloscyllium punctatum]
MVGTGDDAESVSSEMFESQVPTLIPLEELREFVEETHSRRERAAGAPLSECTGWITLKEQVSRREFIQLTYMYNPAYDDISISAF